MSEGGMRPPEVGSGGCFKAASGPVSPECRGLMVARRSRTGKLGGSSAAHEAKTLAFNIPWGKRKVQCAKFVELRHDRGAHCIETGARRAGLGAGSPSGPVRQSIRSQHCLVGPTCIFHTRPQVVRLPVFIQAAEMLKAVGVPHAATAFAILSMNK